MGGRLLELENRILDFIDLKEKEIINFTQDLIRIPTVNPPGNEDRLARFISEKLNEFGMQVSLIHHGEKRSSVVGLLKGINGKKAVMLNGHLDTVPVSESEWMYDPFEARIVDNRIYGRGSTDMKSGVAAIVYAAGAIAQSNIPIEGNLIVSFTADEEVNSIGAKALVEFDWITSVDSILIAEPTDLNVFIAEKGALWLLIHSYGKAAHGSMPEQGTNAVEHLMDLLIKFKENWRKGFKKLSHPLLGLPTASINIFKGGTKANIIPDYAEALIDIRTLPGQLHEEIIKIFQELVDLEKRKNKDLDFKLEVLNNRPPYEVSPSSEVVNVLIDVVNEVKGINPCVAGAPYYTDASIFGPKMRIPILICGPGEPSLAHKSDEYVEISKILEATKIYALWSLRTLIH